MRRAAALTLAKILEGLDRDALTVSVSHNMSLFFVVVVVFHSGAFIHIACSRPITTHSLTDSTSLHGSIPIISTAPEGTG